MAIFVCYCFGMGATSSNVADAALSTTIMKSFYGSYYLDGNYINGYYWFRLYESNDSVASVFRGKYPNTPVIACSDLNSDDSLYISGTTGDNLTLIYKKWSKMVGDSFVPETGSTKVIGYLHFENGISKIRIGSYTYY